MLMGDLGALVTCEWSIFGWLGDWLVERLGHWLLVGCLGDGWLVGRLDGWLIGWLVVG